MSREEFKNQIEGITHYFSEGGYCFNYVKPEDVERLVKMRVQEALNPIIEECKKVIDNPNQLETTKGFASMIWYELQKAQNDLNK